MKKEVLLFIVVMAISFLVVYVAPLPPYWDWDKSPSYKGFYKEPNSDTWLYTGDVVFDANTPDITITGTTATFSPNTSITELVLVCNDIEAELDYRDPNLYYTGPTDIKEFILLIFRGFFGCPEFNGKVIITEKE
jgi:hypothetical protein